MADFGITEIALIVGATAAVAGATTSVISGAQAADAAAAAAAAQQQQAEQAQAIADYNAEIQRQNAEVTYQLSLYQSDVNAQIAAFNQAAANNNAAFAEAQAIGAERAYEQQIENAKQLELEAEAIRVQGIEDERRQREENDAILEEIRAQYASSGVAFEGSPLVVLADSARLAESVVQDIAYATELESRKELRAAEIERFDASYSLLDAAGYDVEAANYQLEADIFAYEQDLQKYDSAIAGVELSIANNEATLTELAGSVEAYGYQFAAEQSGYKATASMISGIGTGLSTGFSGLSTTTFNYLSATKGTSPYSTGETK